MTRTLATLGLLVFFSAGVVSAEEPEEDDAAQRRLALERALPELMQHAQLPGLSIACANRAGVVWSRGFGVRNAQTSSAVDSETVFQAASLSKPVFAHVVLQLVDAGLVELDRPLVEYGSLADVAHDPRHARLTARHALTHTVGLPNWRPPEGRLEFRSDPGSAWSYSGEGFVLLQRVVEELMEASLRSLASTYVFEPLEMTRTSFVWRDDLAANLAQPHDANGEPLEATRHASGNAAYSLLTTSTDYARFLGAVMRGARLSAATRAALATPAVDVSPGVSWGLGWGLEENPDGVALWHWGHNSGFRAYALLYPARDEAFVYFANGDTGMALLQDLVELASGEIDHPALRHLAYESYDVPKYAILKELRETLRLSGVAAAIDRYFELVEGSAGDDAPETVLSLLGLELLANDELEAAGEILRADVELHPDSADAHETLGDAQRAAGDDTAAHASYERALELRPRGTTIRAKLAALGR